MVTYRMYLSAVFLLAVFTWPAESDPRFRDQHACFIDILEIDCQDGGLIVFESARYGRNDSSIAERCGTHYQKNCDIDVTLKLNRNCAGKSRCSLHVNTATFGDPCGYEEFLKVRYQCVQTANVISDCSDSRVPPMYDHGYLASPNYPDNYYRDASCQWHLAVQQRQNIRVTLFDFELDVKHNGKCSDYLEISAGDRVFFKDCGAQGSQHIDIDAQNAVVRFNTELNSPTERGFFFYFQAIGPGCPDLDVHLGSAEYYMEDDVLYANVTCDYGYVVMGTLEDFLQLECRGNYWSENVRECIAVPPLTSPGPFPSITLRDETVQDPTSATIEFMCVVLGIISALLLLSLLLVIILYYRKSKRRHHQEKFDQWRVVVNNLQDNELNEYHDDHCKGCIHDDSDDMSDLSPTCNITKAKRKNKQNDCGKQFMSEEEYMMDYSDMLATPVKSVYDVPPNPKYAGMSRKNSRASIHKNSMQRPRCANRMHEEVDPNKTLCSECGNRTPKAKKRRPQSQRDLRTKRTKSGQWAHNRSAMQTPCETPDVPIYGFPRQITQSAPDLLQLECPDTSWAISPDQAYASPYAAPPPPQSVQTTPYHYPAAPQEDFRGATLGAVPKSKRNLQYAPDEKYQDVNC